MTPEAGPELVALDRVTCRYGTEPVLINVDLSVRPGDFVGVVGPSGSGKTTLLRTVLGSVPPIVGAVRRHPGLSLAYVPQTETVNWNFPGTVGECVLMARGGRTLPWASRSERAEVSAMLERLGIGNLERRHIRQLSGGQQQRVFIARALLRRPQLLLLDEPTATPGSRQTVPATGRTVPSTARSRVVLPDPEGPTTPVKVPAATVRSTSTSTGRSP